MVVVSEFFERQVQRQQERTDPLGRLPWQATLTVALLILVLGLLQVLLGEGLFARVLGLALVLWIGPLNVVSAWARREAQRRRD
jgi:heme O synthase-like polyprenyltransferase